MKCIFIFWAGVLSSLTDRGKKEILKTRYNSDGTIGFQSYDVTINPKAVGNAGEFLKSALKLDPGDSMHLVHSIRKNGNTYLSYQQFYKGYKVFCSDWRRAIGGSGEIGDWAIALISAVRPCGIRPRHRACKPPTKKML